MSAASLFTIAAVPLLIFVLHNVQRRFGPAVAGWLSGFPIVGGPALLIVSIEHGHEFGIDSTRSALQGITAWSAFILVFRLSERFPSVLRGPVALTATSVLCWLFIGLAVTSFEASTAALPLFIMYALVVAVLAGSAPSGGAKPSRSILVLRLVLAPVFVLITILASNVTGSIGGERLSGVLVAFPIVSSTLLISASAHGKPGEATLMSRGMLLAGVGFSSFLFILILMLEKGLSLGVAFGTSSVLAASVHYGALRISSRSSPSEMTFKSI